MSREGRKIKKIVDRCDNKEMKKIALYAAIFGAPQRFNFPKISSFDVDRICFTDFHIREGCNQMMTVRNGRHLFNDFYDMRRMRLDHLSALRANRFIKICIPDEIFDNYEFSLYSDCKRPFTFDFEQMLNCLEPDSDILLRKHRSKRNCAYEEGLYCIEIKKDTEQNIMKQLNFYESEHFPHHLGLFDASWILRRHTKALKEYMKHWWEMIERFSHRDQVSLPYIIWKYNIKISKWKWSE